MNLHDLSRIIAARKGVASVCLEPERLLITVETESDGEEMIDTVFVLLQDEFSTVWNPGHRTVVVVRR